MYTLYPIGGAIADGLVQACSMVLGVQFVPLCAEPTHLCLRPTYLKTSRMTRKDMPICTRAQGSMVRVSGHLQSKIQVRRWDRTMPIRREHRATQRRTLLAALEP